MCLDVPLFRIISKGSCGLFFVMGAGAIQSTQQFQLTYILFQVTKMFFFFLLNILFLVNYNSLVVKQLTNCINQYLFIIYLSIHAYEYQFT